MKWILLLAIIPIIQYGEVAGYPPIIILKNHTPIKSTHGNKLKSPESNCEYCHLNNIIRAAYEATRKKEQQTDEMFGFPESYDTPFEDIFLPPRSARSPRVEFEERYLSNSFDDNFAKTKAKLDFLERKYNRINELLQKAEANEEKGQQTDQISLTEESSYFDRTLWTPSETILSYWTAMFDNDIDYIKNYLELLKTNYERIIDNLKNIAARNKKQQTDHMFVHHGSLFDEPIKDMIQSRSTRSLFLINSFDNVFSRIRKALEQLERNYKNVNEILQKAEAIEEKGQQTDQILSLIQESNKYTPFIRSSWPVELLIMKWTMDFDSDIAYIEESLELLKTNYERVTDNLKKIEDSRKANSQKDKKELSPLESIVSNNNTQENVTQTIPTPDKSTNTQKPVPAKHDDKKDKLVGEKDPLHTPEIAPNNKTSENVIITPVESTTIEKLESTTIKNEEKPEKVEQEVKKDTFVSIKNDNNEKVEPSEINKTIVINPLNPEVPISLEELRKILFEKY